MRQFLGTLTVVAGVGGAFALVAFLVWLTRGRRARLVRAKLYLGGLLLALGVGGCHHDGDPLGPIAMCYSAATLNDIALTSTRVHLKSDPTVRGTIYGAAGNAFTFVMRRSGSPSTEAARGALVADDGAFDERTEPFHFGLPADLAPGAYALDFYEGDGRAHTLGSREVQVVND